MEIREGYQKTEVGVIPIDWEVKSIEELTPKGKKYNIVDGPFGSNLKTIHYRKSGVPIITSGYVTDGKFSANDYLYVDLEKFKQEKRSAVNGGDIVMAKIGERCGACAILPKTHEQGILSGNALKITIDENKHESILIQQIFWSLHQNGDFELLKTTGAQPAISMANLKKFRIPLPSSKNEQTAIATALSDTDALINSLEKLIAKKRNIKQGAMHQLLKPKEGWEVKKLGEIVKTFQLGGNYPNGETVSNFPLIKMGNIQRGFISTDKVEYILSNFNPDKKDKLNFGDVLFNTRNTLELVGKVSIWRNELSEAYFNSNLMRLEFNSEFISSNFFMNLLFNTKDVISKLKDIATGTTSVAAIYTRDLLKIELQIPKKEEQTRIATILSDMDAEIQALETKLEKYRKIKLGMMQNLLTGKIRLIENGEL